MSKLGMGVTVGLLVLAASMAAVADEATLQVDGFKVTGQSWTDDLTGDMLLETKVEDKDSKKVGGATVFIKHGETNGINVFTPSGVMVFVAASENVQIIAPPPTIQTGE